MERESAEREKVEREKVEREKVDKWELSKREREIISYLGEKSTSAIMAILVVYCLKGAVNSDFISNLTLFGGVATTVITHLIFKNTLLSVFVGTVCYMIFIRIA